MEWIKNENPQDLWQDRQKLPEYSREKPIKYLKQLAKTYKKQNYTIPWFPRKILVLHSNISKHIFLSYLINLVIVYCNHF